MNCRHTLSIAILLSLACCQKQQSVQTNILTYRCCTTDCTTLDKLRREQFIDEEGMPIKTLWYSYEIPGWITRTMHYSYKDGKLINVIDSAEYTIRKIAYHYSGDLLERMHTIVSVYSDDAEDFVPTDTITQFFTYSNGRLLKEIYIENKDTTVSNYRYMDDSYFVQSGNTLFRYLLHDNDSISAIEYYAYDEAIPFDDYVFEQDDDIWWDFSVMEFEYDSLWRKIRAHHFDGPRTRTYEDYAYNHKGQLVSIRSSAYCDTLVYVEMKTDR